MDLSFCVVNTDGREHLLECLDAIAATTPEGVTSEVLVLDNASQDGSVEAVEALERGIRVIALDRRTGKAENDSTLLREAEGRYCLLLNEDSELQAGAPRLLLDALEADPRAAVAGCQLLDTEGVPEASAWRLPGLDTALAAALMLHRLYTVQSGGTHTREVGWAQSSAMLVRRAAAEEVGYLDPDFFVYSDETDFCKRLQDAGWRILHVPQARAIHHDQLETDTGPGARRRITEFHRNRDLYMRKHHSATAAALGRVLGAWFYLVRAAAAAVLPGHAAGHWLLHARQALRPGGEGIREAAAAHNRRLERPAPLEEPRL